MSRVGSGPEFHVNSGSGRVGSFHLWVGLGRIRKTRPTSNSGLSRTCSSMLSAAASSPEVPARMPDSDSP